jgi:hypothetical protein
VSGFSTDIAAKLRSNWATEIDTVVPDGELVVAAGELVLALDGEEELLLHAAAARHKASDAETTTAPFLAIGII